MAKFISPNITTGTYVRARIVVEETETNVISNYHKVKIYVQMWRTNSGYTTSGSGTLYIGVTGQGTTSYAITDSQKITKDSYTVMGASRTVTLYHGSDGKLNVNFTARATSDIDNIAFDTYTFNVTLSNIDRAAPNATLTVSNITASSFDISASSTSNIDNWEYSLNNGSTYSSLSTTEGTSAKKTITGLSPNTTYQVKIRARRKYNHVNGYSATKAVKTIGNAVLNSATDIYGDEDNIVIPYNVTVYVASWYHKLSLYMGNTLIFESSALTYSSAGTQSQNYTLTAEQKNLLKSALGNKASEICKLKLETFSDSACSTQIGNISETNIVVSFRTDVSAPTFTSYEYADVSSAASVTGDSQVLVKGISLIEISCSPGTAKNGATITGYSAKLSDISVTSDSASLAIGPIAKAGNMTLEVTCIDSRGFSTTITKNVTVLDYEKPKINEITLRRQNEVDALIQLSFDGGFSPIEADGNTNTNELTVVNFAIKPTSEVEYEEPTSILEDVEVTGTSFSFESLELCELDPEESFNFKLIVKDSFGNETGIEIERVVFASLPLVSFRKKTQEYPFRRIGINKLIPTEALDVGGNVKADYFKANNGIFVGGQQINYVVDEGTEGIWSYRIWSSGVLECWCQKEITDAINNAWGTMFSGAGCDFGDYPIPFASKPMVVVSAFTSQFNGWVASMSEQGLHSELRPEGVQFVRPSSTTTNKATITYCLHAIGYIQNSDE